MKNRRYWVSFESFFKRLFDYLKKQQTDTLPLQSRYFPRIDEEKNHRFELSNTIDFRQLLQRNLQEIKEWKEYLDLSENVILMSEYGEIWEDKDKFHFNFNYIPSVTDDLFQRFGKSFKYSNKIAAECYALLENCIYLDEWRFLVKSPVYDLEIQQRQSKITAGVYIKQIDIDDLWLLVPSLTHHGSGVTAYSPFLRTMLVAEEKCKKGDQSQIGAHTFRTFRDIVAALCVFKKHRFEIGPLFYQPKNFRSFMSSITAMYMPDEIHTYDDIRLITKNEILRFRAFLKKYESSIRRHRWLELASDRLLRLFYEMKVEDRIVDIMTILEILYLPESDMELKYKLSTRCAKILGRSKSGVKEIYGTIKLSYDIRSNVVHAGAISPNNNKRLMKAGLSLNDLVRRLEEYVYRSFEILIGNPEIRNRSEDIVIS